ncbi:hypothetical protein [Streptomyces antarcticus]|uniref:hypothetical protein n=1 Tax=Streptomyces antarcticus TaxID=2996458 RepID=UPI00226F5308|nr:MULTISPECIES: hypothetical protein [unclassified Streptomyces]MCY0945937.1 hypothetical protein [Streptomyces sp. H34-AA3]MCY0951213.1 hypothetical protein [Streptomyces sp. H27-S2]MCZ4083250.1 hypothetical protein [Streptomyces sp. H34-S5]
MNTESDAPNSPTPDWIPAAGIGMRKAGVLFDAVRVDGDPGRSLADLLVTLTGGDPGPIVTQCNGRRPTYFLIPVGGAAYRMWPEGFTRLTSGPLRSSYVPVPALDGCWPLAWRCPPRAGGRLVHALLLHRAAGLYQASCEISSKTTAHASAAGSISGK